MRGRFSSALPFDAVTVAPYMGWDSVRPFLEYKDKWTIVLGLTSNPGAADFELRRMDVGDWKERRTWKTPWSGRRRKKGCAFR